MPSSWKPWHPRRPAGSGRERRARPGSRRYTAFMNVWDELGPFQPGAGGMPPILAGREREQSLFRALLGRLERGAPVPTDVVLYGPRGNGKTVLLQWLCRQADGERVETAVVVPSALREPVHLCEQLAPDSFWERLAPHELTAFGVSWRPGQSSPAPLADVLRARAGKAPLLVVMDEAHTLDPHLGRELLNASQIVRSLHPLLLVLAGTPDLGAALRRTGASFWDRSRQVRLGRLSHEATGLALGRPFEDQGFVVARDALELMVEESQLYPFFVQMIGASVWGEAFRNRDSLRTITVTTVEAARPDFTLIRTNYYARRIRELRRLRLLPVARAVAVAASGGRGLSHDELEHAVSEGLGSDAIEPVDDAMRSLRHLGFVWPDREGLRWEPGIPSLMDFITDRVGG